MGEAKRRRALLKAMDIDHRPGSMACPRRDEVNPDLKDLNETRCADCGVTIFHMATAPREVMKVCSGCQVVRMRAWAKNHPGQPLTVVGPESRIRQAVKELEG